MASEKALILQETLAIDGAAARTAETRAMIGRRILDGCKIYVKTTKLGHEEVGIAYMNLKMSWED